MPTVTLSRFPSTSAHTPNFRASLGHAPVDGPELGDGLGVGLGFGPGQVPQEETRAKKRRLRVRKMAREAELFE